MKIEHPKNIKEAYIGLIATIFLSLAFCLFPIYLNVNNPNINELTLFTGHPSGVIERGSHRQKHIEFLINNDMFYYSGYNYGTVKQLAQDGVLVKLKAYKNHGFNPSMNVVYVLSSNNEHIVKFDDSMRTHNNIIWLMIICAVLSLAGLVYCIKQVIKFKQNV